MNQKRYKELKSKADKQGYINTNEYLEIMSYEQPDYYHKLMRVWNHWDEMNENEVEQILNELLPQDRELVLEQINPN